MDIFVEQIVVKQIENKDRILIILIGAAAGLIGAVGVIFLPFTLALLIITGLFFGAYWLITNFNCEYEYIVTNGEIDIDKIIAKRKRTRLVTVKVSTFEKFGEYNSAPKLESGFTVIKANGKSDTPDYYADLVSSIGNVRLVFSPNERVLDAIKPFLPRNIRTSMNNK